uniref:Embryonic polarity protein dorsal-like isoform X2 n=1 Tax=Diabrotica virgifera virgifera TaxID=50390 RepID=A0A6P7F5M7_DIAVI
MPTIYLPKIQKAKDKMPDQIMRLLQNLKITAFLLDTGTQDDGGLADGNIELSDVIEVIETDPDFKESKEPTQHPTMFNGGGEIPVPQQTAIQSGQLSSMSAKKQARIRIVEQPASKALRFRYECEGRSAGSIPGSRSTPENKSYPTIRVEGYQGRAVVVVSCVTRDQPYRPHPHNLVGREGCKRGVCTLEIPTDTMTVHFSNLGIQCVKKKDIEHALRVREEIRVDPFRTGFSHRNQPTSIDLNVVRLCFQVFLEGDTPGKFSVTVPPVVSDPIYDKKAMSDLTIIKLSDCSSYVDGGRKDIILLCEKVAKEDIQVRFFEENGDWEAFADFQPSQVHKQHAIWFRTPRYKTLDVTDPVDVFIQLRRPSDGATSEALPFKLWPGRSSYWPYRRTLTKKGNYDLFDSILANDAKLVTKRQLSAASEKDIGWKESVLPAEPIIIATNDTHINNQVILIDKSLDQNANDIEIIQDESITWIPTVEANNNQITSDEMDYSELKLNKEDSILTDTSAKVEEKSFNELINQVAELDEIYSDTQARLLSQPLTDFEKPALTDLTYNESFDDAKTYSSLQLAFKNPVDIEIRPTYPPKPKSPNTLLANKRENDAEKLPPLPPKRTKKLETFIGSTNSLPRSDKPDLHKSNSSIRTITVSRNNSFNLQRPKSQSELSPPDKHLPPTPNYSTLPNPKKRGFFSKLFRRGNKTQSANPSREASLSPSTKTLTSTKSLQVNSFLGKSSGNISTHSSNSIRIPLKDSPPSSNLNLTDSNGNNKDTRDISADDIDMNLDLTEAEHYALYTAIAPHATQSEFDEMSCYYAPVEGGKLLTNAEVLARLASKT